MKNWIFDDSFHNKGPVLVIFVPEMIKSSGWVRIRKFFVEIGAVEAPEANKVAEAAEVNEAAEVSKA